MSNRQRVDYPGLKRAVHAMAERYKNSYTLIEDKGSGIQLIQELNAERRFGVAPYTPGAYENRGAGACPNGQV